ncbi:MAG: hypothetical protein WDO70_00885 [Alphaproteobacteria bacterium]
MTKRQDMETANPTQFDEERLVQLARNAMIVAGMEMGEDGDHWPVVKANIHAMMRDYEQLKIERAVQDELKEHVGKIIGEYEKLLEQCPPETRAVAEPHIRQMREIHEAMFSPVDAKSAASVSDEDGEEEGVYVPWKSAEMMIRSLTEEGEKK